MNIQIFGFKNCFDTKKAERYFKERRIKYKFIDLKEKAISKRELESIKASTGDVNKLINSKAKEYKTLNFEFIRNSIPKFSTFLTVVIFEQR